MHTHSRRVIGGAVGLALLAACGGGDGEKTGTSGNDLTEVGPGAVNRGGVALAVAAVDPAKCSFAINNGTGVFTPSPELSQALYQDPNGVNHEVTFSVPAQSYDIGSLLPTLWVGVTSLALDPSSVAVTLAPSTVNFDATLHGSLHIHTPWPWPDADLLLDAVTAHAEVDFTTNHQLESKNVTVDISHHVENCGAFGWCDGFVNHGVPDDIGAMVAAKFKTALDGELAKPTTLAGAIGVLQTIDNIPTPPGAPPWQIMPNTLGIQNSEITFEHVRVWPPAQPQNCNATQLCTGAVEVRCDMIPEMLVLQHAILFGWTTVGADLDPSRPILPDLIDPSPPAWAAAAYRVCATNSAGTNCTAPIRVPLTQGNTCGGGGGGGGGKTPGGGGRPGQGYGQPMQ